MEPFIGQIMAVAFGYAPRGWAFCEGQLLPIAQNTALFSLIGTTYGGDGRTTFALPDLRGRVAVGMGRGTGLTQRNIGERSGAEVVNLVEQQMPSHNHEVAVSNAHGTEPLPAGKFLAGTFKPGRGTEAIESNSYADSHDQTLNAQSISAAGGSQPHNNMQPYLGINYIIALMGEFPSRN
jgi:microcystin-dependent protein